MSFNFLNQSIHTRVKKKKKNSFYTMNNQPTREKLYSQSKGYGFSPALERTRKPFAVRNILTLAGLLTFTGSVCK